MSVLADLLAAQAELLAALEVRSLSVHEEADLRTTVELLPEWAAFVDLAGSCTDGLPRTADERRFEVFRKLVLPGGQNRYHLVQVAQGLGYDVELEDVQEFHAFRVGISRVGDALYEDEAAFLFAVHAPEFTPRFARAGVTVAGEPLVSFGNHLLECTLDAIKPAHTLALYFYDKPYEGYAPWSLEVPETLELALVLPIPSRT